MRIQLDKMILLNIHIYSFDEHYFSKIFGELWKLKTSSDSNMWIHSKQKIYDTKLDVNAESAV